MNFLMWLIWIPFRYVIFIFPYNFALAAAKIIGYLIYLFSKKGKGILKRELNETFPQKNKREIKKIIKKTFLTRSITEIEETLHQKLTPENIAKIIEVQNLEYLKQSLRNGKGVILVTFHFGAYRLVMPALGLRGYKINQVANEWNPSGYWAERLFRIRMKYSGNKLPANIIAIGPGTQMRPLFRCLKKNEILVMALDGREIGNLAQFPFFHYQAYWFATGPVNLALRTGAALHPVFIVRKHNNKNRLIIEKEILLERKSGQDETVIYNTTKLVKLLENYVEQFPSHYGMEIPKGLR